MVVGYLAFGVLFVEPAPELGGLHFVFAPTAFQFQPQLEDGGLEAAAGGRFRHQLIQRLAHQFRDALRPRRQLRRPRPQFGRH